MLLFVLLCCSTGPLLPQSIRIDHVKDQFALKNAIKLNGGLSANAVYYTGGDANRDPFSWVLNAHLQANLFGLIHLPISFALSNLSMGFSYPTLPNRLSLHPSYKWITAHIGDASMNFSPYTLNGVQFSGFGLELKPPNFPLAVAAIAGTLIRASEYDTTRPDQIPTYKRSGAGLKLDCSFEKLSIGWRILAACDDEKS